MKNYFKVWKFQNLFFCDYWLYFKFVFCYMEGVWIINMKILDELFFSDCYFIDVVSWFDLQEKIRFILYIGGKYNLENFFFFLIIIINMRNGIFEYVQWNYRILCYFIKGDLFLKVFEFVDDLVLRLVYKYNFIKFLMI